MIKKLLFSVLLLMAFGQLSAETFEFEIPKVYYKSTNYKTGEVTEQRGCTLTFTANLNGSEVTSVQIILSGGSTTKVLFDASPDGKDRKYWTEGEGGFKYMFERMFRDVKSFNEVRCVSADESKQDIMACGVGPRALDNVLILDKEYFENGLTNNDRTHGDNCVVIVYDYYIEKLNEFFSKYFSSVTTKIN